ncbi:MAG: hypothetical protein QF357_10910, partial [Dehalococcoidia bacterium]|nr:hypothetical protein [Dehalococcoidia bacterium]
SSTESDPDLEVVDVTASEASSAAGADDNAIMVDCIFRNNASDRAVDTWARLRKDDAVWLQEQTISLAKDHEQSVSFVFPGSTLPEADVSAFETECGFGKASFVVE